MLKKNQRLGTTLLVSQRGQKNRFRFETPLFSVNATRNEGKTSRFALIVSKKIDKRAVVRNRERRRLSQAIQANLGQLSTGCDIILFARQEIVTATAGVLDEQVKKAFAAIEKNNEKSSR